MKMFAIIMCFLVVGGTISADSLPTQEDTSSRILESEIIKALEELRKMMKTGTEDFPVLDPFLLDQFHLELEDFGAKGTISAAGVIIENLSKFIIKNLNLALFSRRLTLDLGIQNLIIYADSMVMDGEVDGQEIKGAGHGTLSLVNCGVRGTMRVRIPIFGNIQVYNVDLTVYLGALKSHLTIYDAAETDEDLNEILEYLVPSYVRNHQKELSDMLNPLVEDIVNDFLRS